MRCRLNPESGAIPLLLDISQGPCLSSPTSTSRYRCRPSKYGQFWPDFQEQSSQSSSFLLKFVLFHDVVYLLWQPSLCPVTLLPLTCFSLFVTNCPPVSGCGAPVWGGVGGPWGGGLGGMWGWYKGEVLVLQRGRREDVTKGYIRVPASETIGNTRPLGAQLPPE